VRYVCLLMMTCEWPCRFPKAAGFSLSGLGGFGTTDLSCSYGRGEPACWESGSFVVKPDLKAAVVILDNDAVGDEGCSLL